MNYDGKYKQILIMGIDFTMLIMVDDIKKPTHRFGRFVE